MGVTNYLLTGMILQVLPIYNWFFGAHLVTMVGFWKTIWKSGSTQQKRFIGFNYSENMSFWCAKQQTHPAFEVLFNTDVYALHCFSFIQHIFSQTHCLMCFCRCTVLLANLLDVDLMEKGLQPAKRLSAQLVLTTNVFYEDTFRAN